MLRRIIVTQGDTEPASVEQQRLLGQTAPSLYDLRNLFQVNVEEGRHLWAMVYLLHRYFGRDGREEAEALLERRSGNPDKPRILGAFNEPIRDWLSFYMFTMFTDRDGKYQLLALAESGFDPLARTTRFMLTEEAHHMFVGETGVGRVVDRTVQLDAARTRTGCARPGWHRPADDPALPQSLVLAVGRLVRRRDLVQRRRLLRQRTQGPLPGGDVTPIISALEGSYPMQVVENGRLVEQDGAASQRAERSAARCLHPGLPARRRSLEPHLARRRARLRFKLPGSHASIVTSAFTPVTTSRPRATPITAAEWAARRDAWLPSASDLAYVQSLMHPVRERGKSLTGSRVDVASPAGRSTSTTCD